MSEPALSSVRPFGWGVLMINDLGAADLPVEPATAPDIGVATRSAVAINVQHADDSEDGDRAQVTLAVFIDKPPLGPASVGTAEFRADVEADTGMFEIGDAELIETLVLSPGRWSITVRATPAVHSDAISIWFERVAHD